MFALNNLYAAWAERMYLADSLNYTQYGGKCRVVVSTLRQVRECFKHHQCFCFQRRFDSVSKRKLELRRHKEISRKLPLS